MIDRIREAFLLRQEQDALALSQASDLVSVFPLRRSPSDRFLVDFRCTSLVERAPGVVVETQACAVEVWFPQNYLRSANAFQVLTWLGPREGWHPNLSTEHAAVCIGHLAPATSLVEIVFRLFDLVTWNKVTMREDDAINRAACQWARAHGDRFPVDRRPLKRRLPTFGDIERPR